MTFKMMAILGGKGMLGSDLRQVAEQRGFAVKVYDLPEFDITNAEHIRDSVKDTDVVVNCAAYTNVEKAESEPDLADAVNGYAVGKLGQAAKAAGVPLLHISTDFVFDGTKEDPYVETDKPNPISAYGHSKLLGETLLAESGCTACIFRLEWTYGKHGQNFITKILKAAETQDSLQVVDDQIGSPTYTVEAAKAICSCLESEAFPQGIFHFAASGYTSRYEMACYLFERLGIETPVKPCKTSDFKTAAHRPLNSRFSCEKIESLIDHPIPAWQDMLISYLETI